MYLCLINCKHYEIPIKIFANHITDQQNIFQCKQLFELDRRQSHPQILEWRMKVNMFDSATTGIARVIKSVLFYLSRDIYISLLTFSLSDRPKFRL